MERYGKKQKLSSGTFGVVESAFDSKTSTYVAIKTIANKSKNKELPIQIEREVKILAQLKDCDNCIQLIETLGDHSEVILVMEFMPMTLRTYVSQNKDKMGMPTIHIAYQIMNGLFHAHSFGIAHRDLKPDNILICPKTNIVKIADWGAAKEMNGRHHTVRVCTLWYRAPELLLGLKSYGKRIDIWSFGCILCEMISFKPLFQTKLRSEMYKKVKNREEYEKDKKRVRDNIALNEQRHLRHIFEICGTPTSWHDLPRPENLKPIISKDLLMKYAYTDKTTQNFILRCLCLNPSKRISAHDALDHDYFHDENKL